jgi:hypothetical protein
VKAAVCLLAALLASSCARAVIKLPSGTGEPASDGREALAEATASCAGVHTFTAEAGLSGKIQGQRIRTRLLVGAEAPASARIEAVAAIGAPIFIFTARGGDATLLIPREDRVLEHGRPEEILGAVAGVPLSAEDVLVTLTGCWPAHPDVQSARRFGENWRVVDVQPQGVVTLHREHAADPWVLVAADRRDDRGQGRWQTVYRDFENHLPRTMRITSAESAPGGPYDLELSLSQIETNVPLDADAFRVRIPPGATPISLDELRHARPGVREN